MIIYNIYDNIYKIIYNVCDNIYDIYIFDNIQYVYDNI